MLFFWGGGGIGDFRKKISYRLNSRGKKSCKEIYLAKKKIPTLKKNISLMVNNVRKKNSYVREKHSITRLLV